MARSKKIDITQIVLKTVAVGGGAVGGRILMKNVAPTMNPLLKASAVGLVSTALPVIAGSKPGDFVENLATGLQASAAIAVAEAVMPQIAGIDYMSGIDYMAGVEDYEAEMAMYDMNGLDDADSSIQGLDDASESVM